jgi:hypothetical protein
MSDGVCGNPTVFAPKTIFDKWDADDEPDAPKGFAGILKRGGGSIVVFHDPEGTHVVAEGKGVLLYQTIFFPGDAAVKKHLKNLPAKGWKKTKGTYASDGGEHVLFDGLLFEEEAGAPIRVKLAKGSYVLEEYGIWKPDTKTELVLTRLIPA